MCVVYTIPTSGMVALDGIQTRSKHILKLLYDRTDHGRTLFRKRLARNTAPFKMRTYTAYRENFIWPDLRVEREKAEQEQQAKLELEAKRSQVRTLTMVCLGKLLKPQSQVPLLSLEIQSWSKGMRTRHNSACVKKWSGSLAHVRLWVIT